MVTNPALSPVTATVASPALSVVTLRNPVTEPAPAVWRNVTTRPGIGSPPASLTVAVSVLAEPPEARSALLPVSVIEAGTTGVGVGAGVGTGVGAGVGK